MNQGLILLPVLVQVLLTVAVMMAMGLERGRALKASGKSLDDQDVRLGEVRWSDTAVKRANCFNNQFEYPVLFYAVVAMALALRQVDSMMIWLAWLFVASRIVHAAIHVGPNVVPWRARSFLVGVATLLAMWLMLVWRAVQAGG